MWSDQKRKWDNEKNHPNLKLVGKISPNLRKISPNLTRDFISLRIEVEDGAWNRRSLPRHFCRLFPADLRYALDRVSNQSNQSNKRNQSSQSNHRQSHHDTPFRRHGGNGSPSALQNASRRPLHLPRSHSRRIRSPVSHCRPEESIFILRVWYVFHRGQMWHMTDEKSLRDGRGGGKIM